MRATEYSIQEEGLDRISAIGLCAAFCEWGPEPDFLTITTRKQMGGTGAEEWAHRQPQVCKSDDYFELPT